MKLLLPVIINPPTIRKDRSVALKMDTRELLPEEMMVLLSLSQSEGWMAFSPNQEDVPEIPEEDAELEGKTISQRIKATLYILYKQSTEKGTYVGTFDNYYKEQGEKIITKLKDLIED